MSTNERLPDDLLWEDSHASELALTALADGEDALLSSELRRHVDECDACAVRLGTQAFRAAVTAEVVTAVGALVPVTEPERAAVATPWWALLGAVVVAVVGLVPALGSGASAGLREGFGSVVRVAARLVWMTLTGTGPELGALALAVLGLSTATLATMGVWLARSRGAVGSWNGGAR